MSGGPAGPGDPAPPLMTDAERQLVQDLGAIYTRYKDVAGRGPNRENDLAEFCSRIHDLQYRIMGQAAARAYPGEFRLLGMSL